MKRLHSEKAELGRQALLDRVLGTPGCPRVSTRTLAQGRQGSPWGFPKIGDPNIVP